MEPPEHARNAARTGRESTDALVGRLLDRRYRIGPRIARGGMASVYEATDTRLDRMVAVKVMHPSLGDDTQGDDDNFAQRFVREARAAAKLNHPHVVGVYDQGDDDGVVFLAMEYVPGHTLRDVIRKEAPMSPTRALSLLEPIVSALAAAHRAGLIHRDVKPENVLIGDEAHGGQVKVADFGLAKAVSADTQHTATGGVLIGTVSYLAPELVVDGRSDARADVYAAGVVLYELLTGTKPHEGESPIQVAYRHVHEDVGPPSAVVPDIPAYVDALVARATARDRSQRPADAGVFLHQIHQVAQALRDGVLDDPDLTADLTPREVVGEELTQELPEETIPIERLPAPATATEAPQTTLVRTRPPTSRPPEQRKPSTPVPVITTARRRSVRGPLSFLLVVSLLAGLAGGAWWYGYARYTTTPGVLGVTERSAAAELEQAGLAAEVGTPQFSETVKAGVVLASDPSPGERVLKDGTVTLVVSLGPERYEVPVLKGLTEDQAQDAITAGKLANGTSREKFSDTVPAGEVMRSDPAAGASVKPDAVVNLVVSKGRRPINITDWTGRDADRATAAFERRKLGVEVTSEEFSDTVAAGDIISQDPTTGPLFKGDTVKLVVSKGPELVEVPRVIAQGVEAATDTLQGLGFEVEVRNSENYLGLGFVFSTSPSAGDLVAKGSTIVIYQI